MNYISQQEPNQMWIKKVLMLVLADILIVLISYFIALLLRFDFVFSSIPEEYLMGYLWSMPFWIISTIVIFYICRLYHSIWRLASVAELQMILIAYSILAVVLFTGHAVHADAYAKILLFYRISVKLSDDNRAAFFLSSDAVLGEQQKYQCRCRR